MDLVLEHQARRVCNFRGGFRGDRRGRHRVADGCSGGAVFSHDIFAAEDADEGLGVFRGDDGDSRDLVVVVVFGFGGGGGEEEAEVRRRGKERAERLDKGGAAVE